ncbi:Low affinity NH4+ transporter [Saitoella coloradoensis]
MPLSTDIERHDAELATSSPSTTNGHPDAITDKYASDSASLEPQHDDPISRMSFPHECLFIATLCCAQLMTQAALAQAITPLHIIGNTFNTSNPGELSWFAASYSLTVGTFILIAGRLGDMYGHKLVFVCGFAWFGLWSLIAGLSGYSRSQVFFDICRALQGMGPAFVLPNALAIFGRLYALRPRRKEMVFALFGATAPTGFVVGSIFSALPAVEGGEMGWAWTYYASAIFCVLLAVGSVWIIPHVPNDTDTTETFDYAGAVTGVVGLVLVNFAWNQGPVVGWDVPYTYILLIVGILFLCVFVWVEKRAKHPLVPFNALTSEVGYVLACMWAGWSSFGIWVFYLWQFLQIERGVTPILATAMFVPVVISGLCAALVCGWLLSRIRTSILMTISMVAFTVGNIMVAVAPVHQTYWALTFVAICIMPWGMDMSFPAATISLSNFMPRQHQGIAASLVNTVVNYSISIGLGVAGTVESRVNREGTNGLKGYRSAWYTAIGFAGVGVAVSLLFVVRTWRRWEKPE